MTSLLKLICLFWTIFAGVFASPAACGAFHESIAYDAQTRPSIVYDGVSFLAFAYDSASALVANEKEGRTPETGEVSVRFAELVAAKTIPTPQYYIQEGVRRSVAVREAGLTEVPATIFIEGQAPLTTTLPINQLFSPKAEIPLNSRFLNIQPPIRVPITVEPLGLPGQMPTTPLPNVKLVP